MRTHSVFNSGVNVFITGIALPSKASWASQLVLVVKNTPTNAVDIEIWVQSLGWEDPLEEDMATHSSILAWRTRWTEKPGGL